MTDQGDHINLCKADADMLDRLVSVGFELDQLEGLSTEEEQRATNILHTFGLLEMYPVEDADDALIDVTLARIDQYENKQRERMHIQTADVQATSSGFAFRMPDLISIACMVLIAASVVIWLGRSTRATSISNQCASNMAAVGTGLANYAFDHNGALPTTANPIPVLPAVPSTMMPPGCKALFFSASRTMPSAALSFTEPPGFINSAFPKISHPVASEILFNRIKGVSPIQSTKDLPFIFFTGS